MEANPDKSDKSDADLVCDLNRVGYLPEVWLAPEWIRDLRAVVRYRQQLVAQSERTWQPPSGLTGEWLLLR